MARAKIIIHGDEVGRLLRGEGRYYGVRADMEARGDRVAAAARSSAPVGETGNYRDGIEAETQITDRVTVKVGSDVDYADTVESATGNMSRALDAAG